MDKNYNKSEQRPPMHTQRETEYNKKRYSTRQCTRRGSKKDQESPITELSPNFSICNMLCFLLLSWPSAPHGEPVNNESYLSQRKTKNSRDLSIRL